MSKVEKSDLTAGGDAPPVEVTKTDNTDNIVAIKEVKSIEVMPEDATASTKEIAKEVLNGQADDEQKVEATNAAKVPGEEEVINLDAETSNIITHAAAEDVDVVRTEAQKSVEEAKSSAISLQNEETPQSKFANEEKVKVKEINNRQILLLVIIIYQSLCCV